MNPTFQKLIDDWRNIAQPPADLSPVEADISRLYAERQAALISHSAACTAEVGRQIKLLETHKHRPTTFLQEALLELEKCHLLN